MDFWIFIYIIDWLFFGIVAITVLYLAFFAIAGLFSRHSVIPKARHQNRFIILIPAYKKGRAVFETVRSVLGQIYPQRMFDVTVISDHEDEMTNIRLAQYPITLLIPNFGDSSKLRSLQFAINNLPQFKIYDIVLILDAGTVIEQEFLQQMNDAYEISGTKAIQAHRLSKTVTQLSPTWMQCLRRSITPSSAEVISPLAYHLLWPVQAMPSTSAGLRKTFSK